LAKIKSTSTRTRLSPEQRQLEIVQAARQVFESQGYEASTIADIAKCVGVVEGTVLHYFKTKRALMTKVIEEFYSDITGAMEDGVAGINGIRNKIRYVIHTHMSVLHDNANLCTVILNESRSSQNELLEKVHELNRRYSNIIISIVREGKESGEIADFASPILVRNVVFGGIEHYLWDIVSGGRRPDIDKIADQLTQLVYSGIMNRQDDVSGEVNQLIVKLNNMIK
tara:strand:- start:24503 stop:25180 length:678 start_codon:yes stop_codon:yes gene_type:complete